MTEGERWKGRFRIGEVAGLGLLLLPGLDEGCLTTCPTEADEVGSFLLGDSLATFSTSTMVTSFEDDESSSLTGESILILFDGLSTTSVASLIELSPLDSLFLALFCSFARTVSSATG